LPLDAVEMGLEVLAHQTAEEILVVVGQGLRKATVTAWEIGACGTLLRGREEGAQERLETTRQAVSGQAAKMPVELKVGSDEVRPVVRRFHCLRQILKMTDCFGRGSAEDEFGHPLLKNEAQLGQFVPRILAEHAGLQSTLESQERIGLLENGPAPRTRIEDAQHAQPTHGLSHHATAHAQLRGQLRLARERVSGREIGIANVGEKALLYIVCQCRLGDGIERHIRPFVYL
jgi:hypothetical protein